MNVAHTLIAIGKSRRQYTTLCTRPLGSIFCLFFPPPPLQIYFSSHAIPHKSKCSTVFCFHFFYLVVPHVLILCGLSFQFDVLYLQQRFPATVKLAMRCLPMWFHRNNLRSWQQLVIAWQLQFVQHGTCSGPTMPHRFVHTCHPRLFRHCSHI